MTEPYVFSTSKYTVALYGPQPSIIKARELAVVHGANPDRICAIKAASNATCRGFKEIQAPNFGSMAKNDFDNYADGVTLTKPGDSAILWTAGCPSDAMLEHSTNTLLFTHSGRPALTPKNDLGEPINNIITLAYQQLVFGVKNPQVEAFIAGCVCPEHFRHDKLEAQPLITPFDQIGEVAFTNRIKGTLDLKRIIIWQLLEAGVLPQNIHHDGLCTAETPWLTDYRTSKNKEARNVVIAVLH
ncbi:laccase domain-containing protein [Candidatus Kaiserbacteria bacterium]|nr:laccase domain-containing protein [Candidatus Kaiserbacteria bacterium]